MTNTSSSLTEIEQIAILQMSVAHIGKLTDQDAEEIYAVGASFLPEDALIALARRYPKIMFRHVEDVPEPIVKAVSREYPEDALVYGMAHVLEVPVVRNILLNDPEKLVYLRGDQNESIIDVNFARDLAKENPLATLRYAASNLDRETVEDIGMAALLSEQARSGYSAAWWSSYRLEGSLQHTHDRLFSSALGMIGQGWQTSMGLDLTNVRESGRINHGDNSFFLVEAIKYSIENVDYSLGKEIAQSCVLQWDLTQFNIPIASLSDFHHSTSGDMRKGTWFYPKYKDAETMKSFDASVQAPGFDGGRVLLSSGGYNSAQTPTSFSIIACFGTQAPALPSVRANEKAPYLRITLLGRPIFRPVSESSSDLEPIPVWK